MNNVGIMQGRIIPPSPNKLQVFPENWENELKLMNQLGFGFIELLDDKQSKLRKILTEEKQYFFSQIKESDLQFNSICMDYLSKISLLNNPQEFFKGIEELMLHFQDKENLIFVIPFFENNFIKEETELGQALEKISNYNSALKERKQFFSLELDMPAEIIKKELKKKNLSNIKICYDLGNRIEHGTNLPEEINVLSGLINHVHIKDKQGGKNIRIRENLDQLHNAFKALKETEYNGFLVFETNPFPDPVDEARSNLKTVRDYLGAIT